MYLNLDKNSFNDALSYFDLNGPKEVPIVPNFELKIEYLLR